MHFSPGQSDLRLQQADASVAGRAPGDAYRPEASMRAANRSSYLGLRQTSRSEIQRRRQGDVSCMPSIATLLPCPQSIC